VLRSSGALDGVLYYANANFVITLLCAYAAAAGHLQTRSGRGVLLNWNGVPLSRCCCG
jgi:hypothetical protein